MSDGKIRTLGFWQPYGSLMLNGKIETRIIEQGKKPPFPLGEYIFYTTQKSTPNPILFDWCGAEIMSSIIDANRNEPTANLHGYAIAKGELTSIRPMTKSDEVRCFIRYFGVIEKTDKQGKKRYYHQQCLIFEDVKRIEPFEFKFGKQGIGIANDEVVMKIKPI